MAIFDTLGISGSALMVHRKWLDAVSDNMANVNTVNPYDADQCAEALRAALEMPEREQRARMRLMRGLVAEFNVFRWAGRMLIDAAGMRKRRRLLDRLVTRDAQPEPVSNRRA